MLEKSLQTPKRISFSIWPSWIFWDVWISFSQKLISSPNLWKKEWAWTGMQEGFLKTISLQKHDAGILFFSVDVFTLVFPQAGFIFLMNPIKSCWKSHKALVLFTCLILGLWTWHSWDIFGSFEQPCISTMPGLDQAESGSYGAMPAVSPWKENGVLTWNQQTTRLIWQLFVQLWGASSINFHAFRKG